ncbi:uncharacterized protein EI90DRAFT_3042621 [Cantharellus anzutake]|uniref:uncharacterized protein n=1 Tax=Cantharellus anzutake TaxID=1750568 RepID=UPI001903D83B|nr:uncharacterized protein EI90DRAFT_3042621 [Cantharellus anzutake]KAF8337341.1 hypothetical protein EI90DRAFT_3042621 [Cantharellus anzutake]
MCARERGSGCPGTNLSDCSEDPKSRHVGVWSGSLGVKPIGTSSYDVLNEYFRRTRSRFPYIYQLLRRIVLEF